MNYNFFHNFHLISYKISLKILSLCTNLHLYLKINFTCILETRILCWKKKHTKYICIKRCKCPMANALSRFFFSTTMRNRSLQTGPGFFQVHLSEVTGLWIWITHRNNSISLFYNCTRTSLATMSMNTWKNDFKQDLEKSGWPQGQGSTPAWVRFTVSEFNLERVCVCAHICVCVYTENIYIYK